MQSKCLRNIKTVIFRKAFYCWQNWQTYLPGTYYNRQHKLTLIVLTPIRLRQYYISWVYQFWSPCSGNALYNIVQINIFLRAMLAEKGLTLFDETTTTPSDNTSLECNYSVANRRRREPSWSPKKLHTSFLVLLDGALLLQRHHHSIRLRFKADGA